MSKLDFAVTEFKGGSIYTLRLILKNPDMTAIIESLNEKFLHTGSLLQDEAVIIDAQQLECNEFDWASLIEFLEKRSLHVIGVSAHGPLLEQAKRLGLRLIDPDNLPNRQAPEPTPTQEPVPMAAKPKVAPEPVQHANPTMVLRRQLRSGQRVYARNADLIVMGSVSPGAEVIADGNIHIYGTLRGRAIAGARGDTSARIFTMRLDAELVAIAGIYQLIDADFTPEVLNKEVMIELDNESLIFKKISELI
ncbi:septum site-determining protein MinC [Brackiella oedipodis]|uniref:septum site-determining protein MinC n=1 Tax=Brackiella oedipodis TaxID=124225 RepID=UPI0004911BDA|nr:septum site-determining protein MinC [Brackiella oedipodis]